MDLIGLPLLVLLSFVLVAAVCGTVMLWNQWSGREAWAARSVSLAVVMLLPVVVAGDAINRDYGFYSSWDDLLQTKSGDQLAAGAALRHQRITSDQLASAAAAAAKGHGTLLPWVMRGRRSGILRSGYIYLPAAYFDKARPTLRFPVVEFLHGYIGSPHNWLHAVPMAQLLDTEIAAGRMPPVIAVAPKTYDTHDGECVDAVRGQRNETYLAVDVPTDIAAGFRVATGPAAWSTIGFSTGGFCAVNMALHYPDTYRAAVSLSGYFTPLVDKQTGNLYRGERAVQQRNSPLWWVQHYPVRPALYVFASGGDRAATAQIGPLFRSVRPGTDLTVATVRAGGHNAAVWQAAIPPALDWLGSRLPAATTSALIEQGATVITKPQTAPSPRSPADGKVVNPRANIGSGAAGRRPGNQT